MVANQIPGSKLIEYSNSDHFSLYNDARTLNDIEHFLTVDAA